MIRVARLFRSDAACLALIVPLAALLFATGLGGRDLWAPDEPRTGVVVRDTLETGSWSVLHENGSVWTEKPPLYYWLAAIASLPAGRVTEWALRLPSSLAAVVVIVLTFYFGRALFGRRTGALAAIVLATTQGFVMEARWAHPDMLWCLFLLGACLAFFEADRRGGDRRWLASFYLQIGLAVLTKGPLGLVLPILAVAAFHAVVRDPGVLRRTGWSWGLPLALLPIAIWIVAWSAAAGGPFPVFGALGRLAARFTEGVHHPQPFFHTFLSLPVEFLPWTILLPLAVMQTAPRRTGRADRETIYLYAWTLVFLSVFALSAEKRAVYLLPILPFLAVLVARVWDTALMDWEPSPVGRPIAWSIGAGLLLVAGAGVALLPRLAAEAPDLWRPGLMVAAILALTCLAALGAQRRHGPGAGLHLFAAGMVVCHLVVALAVLPPIDARKSARPFALRAVAAAGDAPIGIYPDFHAAYAFYAGRRLAHPRNPEELRVFLASAPRVVLIVEEVHYEAARRILGIELAVLHRERVGHRTMLIASSPS